MTEEEDLIYKTISKDFVRKSGYWYGVKCPFCGDSKTARSVHLYIRLAGDNDIGMKCYRIGCDVARKMGVSDAIKLGISDQRVLKMLSDNKGKRRDIEIVKTKNNIRLVNTEVLPAVYEYFKTRTNIDLTPSLMEKYSVILNVKEFIHNNNINSKTMYRIETIIKETDNKVIGFLNRDRTLLYLRCLKDDCSIKHEKINITTNRDTIHSPYEIKHNVDGKDKGIYIFHSEGVFDAVNTSYHITGGVPHYSIASLGYSHLFPTMREYSRHFRDVTTVINRDGDVDPLHVEKHLNRMRYRFNGDLYYIYDKVHHDLGDYSKGLNPTKELITLR